MYIKRDFEDIFAKTIRSRKVLVVYGSRQTGKTTVIEKLLESPDIKRGGVLVLDGDIEAHRDLLNYQSITPEKVRSIVGKAKTFFIDEAQKILDIGLTLKIIHDKLKDIHIVATGSSSFELSEEVGEPLTGRMANYVLPPLSFTEIIPVIFFPIALPICSIDRAVFSTSVPDCSALLIIEPDVRSEISPASTSKYDLPFFIDSAAASNPTDSLPARLAIPRSDNSFSFISAFPPLVPILSTAL